MSNKFLDFAGLSYLIGKLMERFLGKTDTAASATKLATARKINGVSFDGTSDINVKDDTKLPLSGGTMTGGIQWSTPASGIYPVNDTTNNYKYIQIISGAWRAGSSIELYSDDSEGAPSEVAILSGAQAFRFKNSDASIAVSNKYTINKWGAYWSDLTGGTAVLSNTSNGGSIELNSASSDTKGAHCRFFSSDWAGDTAGAGRFNITAVGTSGSATLMGTPSGGLSWLGLPLNSITFSAYLVVTVSSGATSATINYTTPTGYTAIPINARTHGWGGGSYILNFSNSSATIWCSQASPSTPGSYSVGCDILFIRNFN